MDVFDTKIKNKLGFGCMRLPLKNDEIDDDEFKRMIDYYLSNGFNYFDTARVYMNYKCEAALKRCLVDRYPREDYFFVNKLSTLCFEKEEEIIPYFNDQLRVCGLDYFDLYILHSQTENSYPKYKRCKAYEKVLEFKKQGKIKHIGMSFHSTPELLDEILTTYPFIEIVQLQYNYYDYDHPATRSKELMDVAIKHHKPVIVMEPVRGGLLANLTTEARKYFDELGSSSSASYAIRYAASHPNVTMVLSGMSNLEQMKDNVSFMKNFVPFNDEEYKAVEKVKECIKKDFEIPCTGCRYCTEKCPKDIKIPDLFGLYNNKKLFKKDWNTPYYYQTICENHGKPDECIKCGQCELNCPQHLKIRDLLIKVKKEFGD